jgi:hypothetical protein
MTNEEKARDICSLFNEVYGVNIERESHIYSAAINMAKWKDEKFNDLLESELKRWSSVNDSCEAKYRSEMLKELIEKTIETWQK